MKVSYKDIQRLVLTWIGITVFFGALVVQFFKLQVIEGEKWNKKAQRQHFSVIKEPFARGTFFSNHELTPGHPSLPVAFAIDVPKVHLFIDPKSIPEERRTEIAERLMEISSIPEKKKDWIFEQFEKKSRSRKIAQFLDLATQNKIFSWWYPFARKHKIARNAIFFEKDYKRSYPFKSMLGQVLHTIRDDKDPVTKTSFPTGGLENTMNQYLTGKPGIRRVVRAPSQFVELKETLQEVEHGADVYLTINHHIQAICEEELKKGVLNSKAKGGWAIIMDPFTGEILAFAQYPFFDLRNYRKYFNKQSRIEHTRSKPIQDVMEPGSIMKPVTLAIALLANEELKKRGEPPIFDPKQKMPTRDPFFPGRKKPLKDLRVHNYLNMYMALQKSSNIYMARLIQQVVERLGKTWYRDCLTERFGFGQQTGIELPAENAGMVPRPGRIYPNGALEWSRPTPYSLAMGYNILANSLQMLRAHSVLINGGYLVQPTLIRKVVAHHNHDNQVVLDKTHKYTPLRKVLPKAIADHIKWTMQFTTKPGGSAPLGDVPGFTEGGKTGSAEKLTGNLYSKKKHISSFVGFVPATEPRFIMIVVMDEPAYGYIPGYGKTHMGGRAAAPVFSHTAKRVLHYLGEVPDDPYGYPIGDARYDPEKAVFMKESKQLKELYIKWNQ